MKWKLTYFNGKVAKETLALPEKLLARYQRLADVMSESGPDLGMPHTRSLGGGLLELRVKGDEGIARVFYCTVVRKEIVILHTFIKKTQKTPGKEMDIARQRLKEVRKNG